MSGIYERAEGYKHAQTSASATWTITHNLGTTSPVVDCWIDLGGGAEKILPLSVIATSDKVVTITFSSAYAGVAFVS